MSALSMVAGKSFICKFTAKIDFSDRVFYITIADADIGGLKSLIYIYLIYLKTVVEKSTQVPFWLQWVIDGLKSL